MKKVTDLPYLANPAGNDIFYVVDADNNVSSYTTRADILRDAIDTVDLKDNSVTSDKLPDGGLTLDKLDAQYVAVNHGIGTETVSATFIDTSLEPTLTTAGVWVITANLRFAFTASNTWAEARLYNNTTAADADTVAGSSDFLIGPIAAATSYQLPAAKSIICVATTASNIITLQARRGTATNIALTSDVNGMSSMMAYRIG